MSVLFQDQKAKKPKRSETLSNALLALNSIHMLLIFGLLLATASAIFLALPREDVSSLGVLRIALELFLLALTVLGAVVLYRPFQNMSLSVILAANIVLIAANFGIRHQLEIESDYPKSVLGVSVLALSILFLVEARLYQFRLLGGLAALGFLVSAALIAPTTLMLAAWIIAAAVLLIVIADEQTRQRIDAYVPVRTILEFIYLSIPFALTAEFTRDAIYLLDKGDLPSVLMMSTWFAAGFFYLVNAEVSESQTSASASVLLFVLGAFAVELYNPFYGGAAWGVGALFVLIGALDIYLQDHEHHHLAPYGRICTKTGVILTTCGLLYSAIMHPSDAISFSGLNLMEVVSQSITLGLNHPPALLLIVGSILVFGTATGLARRSLELSGALVAFSLLYQYGVNQLVERVQSPDLTGHLGWLIFPLAVGMIAIGLYGDWLRARRRSILPYLAFGGWWAVVSTVLTLVEQQNGQGALLFALYAAFAAFAAYQTGLRPLVAVSSTFTALALSYFLLPTGLEPGQIALILLAIAFAFYLLSLLLFMGESTRPLGYTLHLIGISMLTLAAFFALAWVKVSPEVFTLALALGGVVVAIEYFQRKDFTMGYVALTVAMVAFWITIHYLPGSMDKLQFYAMSIGAYAIATHLLQRSKGDQQGAVITALCALFVVLGATFYQLFLMPEGNDPNYFGVLVIQVSLLFFVGLFLRSQLFVTIPLSAFLVALVFQLVLFLWEAGSGGLVSIILIMTVIGVPAIMAGITLAVARDSLVRAGRVVQDQLEEWKL